MKKKRIMKMTKKIHLPKHHLLSHRVNVRAKEKKKKNLMKFLRDKEPMKHLFLSKRKREKQRIQ